MVYLAELLVVMSDRFKNVTICARNAPCAHGRKYVRRRRQINEWVQFDQSIVDAPIDLQWRHAAGL